MPTYRIIRLFDVTATQRIDIDFPDHDSARADVREIAAHEAAKGSPEDGNLEHAAIEVEDGAEQMRVRYMLDHIEDGQLEDEVGYFECPAEHERVEYAARDILASLRAILPFAESRAEDMLETAGEAENRAKLSPNGRRLGGDKNLAETAREARADADKAVAAVDAAKALLASLEAVR